MASRRGIAAAALLVSACCEAAAAEVLPRGFVRLRERAPEIRQDIRYATPFNFTGAPVPGYGRPECVLTEPAAAALIRVETRLAARGYRLKLFDCYRPARAVRRFLDWGKQPGATETSRVFHPDIPRETLVARGFIGAMSSHSRGSTVDAGLASLHEAPLPTPATSGRCDGAFSERPVESSLDLGTSFDCFSEKSAIADLRVGRDAAHHRAVLRDAMQAEGFRGYSREWWHFTLAKEPHPRTLFDFPID